MLSPIINLLLIEDNEGDARLIEIYLHEFDHQESFKFTHVNRLSEGIKLLANKHYDLILLDLTLPDCSGLTTFKKIHAAYPGIPVVVLTGVENEEVGLSAVKLGAQDFLTKKQLEGSLLIRSIRYAIERKKADDRLHFHANILENVRDSIIVTDFDGIITYWNKGSENIFGYSSQEMIGNKSFVLFPDYTMEEFSKLKHAILNGNELSSERKAIRKDDSEIWMDNKISAMHNLYRTPSGILIVGKEITDRKRALEELKRHKFTLSESQKLAHLGSFIHDLISNDFFWSDEMYSIFEQDHANYQPTFQSYLNFIHPDDREKIKRAIAKLNNSQKDVRHEYRIKTRSGRTKYLDGVYHPIFNEEGKLVQIMGTELDITERKQYEEQLASSERRYRTLFHGANDEVLIFQMTPEHEPQTFAEVNNYTCNLLGYSHEELLSMTIYDIIEVDKIDTTACFNHLFEKNELVMECGHVTKNRRKIPVEVNAHLFQMNGQPTVLLIGRDITERRKLEQEILAISEQERRRIGQDLHDGLGQMLTGIGLITRNLAKKLKSNNLFGAEDVTEIADLIQEADEQARGLARGLIPVYLEANGLTTALKQLTEKSERLFNIKCTFESTGIPLVYDNTQALHLYRIAQESINNAIKHGKASKISVFLAPNEDSLILRVTDDGIGFSYDASTERGMGVQIMFYRARMIGGVLNIRKTPRGGTIVSCTIPVTENMIKQKRDYEKNINH